MSAPAEEGGSAGSEAPVAALPQEDPILAALRELTQSVTKLLDRVGELEDAVAENAEEIGKVREVLRDLRKAVVKKKDLAGLKQLKKLKKLEHLEAFLDRIEIVDEAEEPNGRDERGSSRKESGEHGSP